jgi:hypothetical protein
MSKTKKPAATPRRKSSWEPWRVVLHAMIGVIFLSGAAAIFRFCQIYVDRRLAFPERPPKVYLKDRPAWMSDFLADQIMKTAEPIGLHSAYDRQLLVDTAAALRSDPWIRRVIQVRRVYDQGPADTLEIDCEYRAPVALVGWDDFYWLVDGEGIKLPEQYTGEELSKIIFGPDGKPNVRIIQGAQHAPPESGKRWAGDDLAAGLELARLLSGRDYADQIRLIDVSNFNGRLDPSAAQIVLVTQFNTQIRWGRPPSARDSFVEVPASTKLDALANIFRQTGRVDADQPWIDVRFDRVTCPAAETPPAGAPTADAK